MAIITPQTDVYFLKMPLEINDTNQLTFSNLTAQLNYFNGLTKLHIGDDFTYQRKDGIMRVPALIDDLYGYNYCMYKNKGHGDKWFFAFITGMEYLNDSVTGVSLKTDTWQTWQFDLTYKRTFIEREHVNSDTIGLHTVPENLEIGEYVLNGNQLNVIPDKPVFPYGADRTNPANAIGGDMMIVFQTTEIPDWLGTLYSAFSGKYNNLFSGLYYFGTPQVACARHIIKTFDDAGKAESIVSVFYAPIQFFDYSVGLQDGTYGTVYVPQNSTQTDSLISLDKGVTMPTKLGTYTPKNNKLFTYPYSLVRVSNNAGGDFEYRYEDFALDQNNKPNVRFGMRGSLGQGCSIKLLPKGYKGKTNYNYGYGVVGAKYPQCAWKSDYYTNWLTQNAVNLGAGLGSSIAKAGLGIAASAAFSNPLGIASGAVGLASSIAGTVGQMHEAQVHPDQARGDTSCADMMFGYKDSDLSVQDYTYYYIYQMCIKPEYASIVDNYFSMFGYKVNEVKLPNITGRRNWNYVKTVGCYIEADIPQDDLEEIKSMFNKGITLWHNPSTFMDYSQTNDII